nr:hypothetical protein [Liquorilactobacillus satsumensis]
MTDKLKTSKALDFKIVKTKKKADQGLKKGKYYMVVTFPEKFSKNAVSLLKKKPQKMVVHYRTTSGLGFTASKLSQGAVKALAQSVSAQVTELYSRIMFNNIKELGKGMRQAGAGNSQLAKGGSQLNKANAQITSNLNTLAASSLTFSSGAAILNKRLSTYINGGFTIRDRKCQADDRLKSGQQSIA